MDNRLNSLFKPINIGGLTARNRIVMPPMNTNLAHGDGFASETNRDYYAERARGGAGIVILEAMFVEWAAKHRTFGMGVSEDKYIPGLAKVARGIKENGALAMAQINHNGRLLSEDATGLQTVAVSTFVNPATSEVSLEFSTEEVQEMVGKYAAAALRVREAGFDGVEIHGAHGYLLAQFLSPFTNKRTDQYGGSLENRMRMPLQVVRRVRQVCGNDFIIGYRISGEEYFQGGLTLEETTLAAQELEKAGVDLLDVSGSSLEGPSKLAKVIPCYYLPHGFHMHAAAAMKKVVSIPVIGVGRINCPVEAANYLNDGKADLVAVGRQFIADAHWPKKAKEGRLKEIRRCIACNVCLDILLANKLPLTCAVNPSTIRADEHLAPADTKKKVAVVGAGPAGLAAATVAAARGHQVTLFEAGDQIGGQLNLAVKAPGKQELSSILEYYNEQIAITGVDLKLGTEADVAVIKECGAEVAVIASGGKPKSLGQTWEEGENVFNAWDVLSGAVTPGHKVVIVGGGRVGLETAEFLLEQGHEVTVVEAAARIGADLGLTVRPVLMNRLIRSAVNVFNNATITEISGNTVTLDRMGDVITLNGVGTVLVCVGTEANLTLGEGLDIPFHTIGDCAGQYGIMEAIKTGVEAGSNL